MRQRATLIQGVGGFLAELEPHFSNVVQEHSGVFTVKQDFVRWMVRQLSEMMYCLFDQRHNRADQLFNQMFDDLQHRIPFSVGACFVHYIAEPHIYPENFEIEIDLLKGNILVLHFDRTRTTYNTTR